MQRRLHGASRPEHPKPRRAVPAHRPRPGGCRGHSRASRGRGAALLPHLSRPSRILPQQLSGEGGGAPWPRSIALSLGRSTAPTAHGLASTSVMHLHTRARERCTRQHMNAGAGRDGAARISSARVRALGSPPQRVAPRPRPPPQASAAIEEET